MDDPLLHLTQHTTFKPVHNPHKNNQITTQYQSFTIEKSIFKEAYILLKLSLQIAFLDCMRCTAIQIFFVAHLPNTSQIVSATSIAHTFNNIIIHIPLGFITTLYTLIPQFVGSNQIHLISLTCQRAFWISFIANIPISIMLLYNREILSFLGVNTNNDTNWDLISNFCYVLLPCSYLECTLIILHRLVQNLQLNFQTAIIQTTNFIIAICLNYIFIYTFNFGYIGVAIVKNIILSLHIILNVLLLINKGYSFIFIPLPFDQKGLNQYLRLAVPGGIHLTLSNLIKNSVKILSSFLSNSSMALSISSVMWQLNKFKILHSSIGSASGIRVGKYVGANSIYYAKRCIIIQMIYELLLMIILYVVFIMFPYHLPKLVTNNVEISSLISDNFIFVLVLNQFNRGIYRNIIPVYRALGCTAIIAIVGFITQYLITFPLTLYMLFGAIFGYYDNLKLGIYIIWTVDSFGYMLANICLVLIMVCYVDWNKALEESRRRIQLETTANKAVSYPENYVISRVL